MLNRNLSYLIIIIVLFFVSSCSKDETQQEAHHLSLSFSMHYNNKDIRYADSEHLYTNAAGNHFYITDIRLFLSELQIWHNNYCYTATEENFHYFDSQIESSLIWNMDWKDLPSYCDSICFTVGLSPKYNQSHYFLNPPQCDMAWPDMLGGGYHHLMVNGKLQNEDETFSAFNLHLGRYISTPNYENNAHVCLSCHTPTSLHLVFHIDRLLNLPTPYDFNTDGTHIMQNQPAMQHVGNNLSSAFSLTTP